MDQITEGLRTVERRGTSEIRDGMAIDWDVPITVDDGLVLRADVYRPIAAGRYPVILSYGPYAKWLLFKDGYSTAWEIMVREHPDVPAGSTNAYQSWEVVDPEKWVRTDTRSCASIPGRRPLARIHRSVLTARDAGHLPLHRMGGASALEHRQDRDGRHLPTTSTNGRWRRCSHRISPRSASGRRRRLVPRQEPPRRHPLLVPEQLV